MIAVFGAYVSKSVALFLIGFVNLYMLSMEISDAGLFQTSRKNHTLKSNRSANVFQEWVQVLLRTVFRYLFIDPVDRGIGWYMNRYKMLESSL